MLPRQSVLRSAARHCSTRGTPVVGVLGAGQMGGGIAQVAAVQAGCKVVLVDVKQEQLDKCMGLMDKLLAKDVAKDRLTEADKAAALARITTSTDMSAFGGASFLIEAATENVGLKLDLFRAMDSVAPSGAILASNTSSISITKMAAATARPEAVIGMHFMNPVPVMKLVEVIPGLATSEATLADTLALATAMGKTCTQSRDIPGFIANRILMPYINEAVQTLYEGIGTVEAIDTSMKLGTNVPMGPLTLADFIGLDTCLAIMQARPPLRTRTHAGGGGRREAATAGHGVVPELAAGPAAVDSPTSDRAPAAGAALGAGRLQVPPLAAARAARQRGLAGKEVRPRLLRLPQVSVHCVRASDPRAQRHPRFLFFNLQSKVYCHFSAPHGAPPPPGPR